MGVLSNWVWCANRDDANYPYNASTYESLKALDRYCTSKALELKKKRGNWFIRLFKRRGICLKEISNFGSTLLVHFTFPVYSAGLYNETREISFGFSTNEKHKDQIVMKYSHYNQELSFTFKKDVFTCSLMFNFMYGAVDYISKNLQDTRTLHEYMEQYVDNVKSQLL